MQEVRSSTRRRIETNVIISHLLVSFQSMQLQVNMEHLKDDWAEFLKEQQRLKEEVNEEHAKAVGQLSTKYSEKKKDLTKFSLL